MAILTRLSPSVAIQGLVAPQTQSVPFLEYIGNVTNQGDGGMSAAYIPQITNINGEANVGQQWGVEKTRQSYTMGQIQASFYKVSAYLEWNKDEVKNFAHLSNGVALPDFLRNLATQAINQRIHEGVVYGFDPATELSQGILANAVLTNLPADSKSADKITTYNTAELNSFLTSIIRDIRSTSYGILAPTVIASSSRIINYLMTAIVPLTESQRAGAGVDTPAGMLNRAMSWLGAGEVKFIEDNTLQDDSNTIGDKIVFIATGSNKPQAKNPYDQNLVGEFNSIAYNTWFDAGEGLVCDPGQLNNGVYSETLSVTMTTGVTIRKEAVRVVTAKFV